LAAVMNERDWRGGQYRVGNCIAALRPSFRNPRPAVSRGCCVQTEREIEKKSERKKNREGVSASSF